MSLGDIHTETVHGPLRDIAVQVFLHKDNPQRYAARTHDGVRGSYTIGFKTRERALSVAKQNAQNLVRAQEIEKESQG